MKEVKLSKADLGDLACGVLSKNASFRFQVKGTSMTPFIKDGDVVVLSKPYSGVIHLGMPVAIVCPPDRFFIHRVVARKRGLYLIKGDNISQADGSFAHSDIIGMVTKIERGGRQVRLGLGPERLLIAFLSRIGLLSVISWGWMLMPCPIRQMLKNNWEGKKKEILSKKTF
jgi:Peptidase S24-like